MGYSLNPSSFDCYEGTTCLINKLNIRDERVLSEIESQITFTKASMLEIEPIDGSFDFEHYKAIHKFLFDELYDWAGTVRTTDIAKKRTSFTKHQDIERIGTACLRKIQNGYLDDLPFDEFVYKIAELYHDINMLHPFREGNGRTQRIFFAQLIRHYDYSISFSDADTDFLMIATIQAAQGVLDGLVEFFSEAIEPPQQNITM